MRALCARGVALRAPCLLQASPRVLVVAHRVSARHRLRPVERLPRVEEQLRLVLGLAALVQERHEKEGLRKLREDVCEEELRAREGHVQAHVREADVREQVIARLVCVLSARRLRVQSAYQHTPM